MADCTRVAAPAARGILQCERVHHGAEHAHVVGATAVHAALAELGATEEVAAADDDGDVDAVDRLGDLAGDLSHDVGIHAQLAPAERLPDSFSRTRRRLVASSITCDVLSS